MPKFSRVLVSFSVAGLLSGCALAAKPSIPGFDDKVTVPDAVPVSTVINALQCQMSRAFMDINNMKDDYLRYKYPQGYGYKGMVSKDSNELKPRSSRSPEEINDEKTKLRQKLSYRTGSVVFSGQTVYVNQNGATISAAIPITGLANGSLGPDIGGNIQNTRTDTIQRSFDIKAKIRSTPPVLGEKPELADIETDSLPYQRANYADQVIKFIRASIAFNRSNAELPKTTSVWQQEVDDMRLLRKNGIQPASCHNFIASHGKSPLQIGDFLQDSIFESFKSTTNPPNEGVNQSGALLELTDTEVKITAAFAISYGINGGLSPTIPVGAPSLTSISPGLTGDYTETGTYSVVVTLPITSANTSDTRKLIYCDESEFSSLCVEEPFSEATRENLRQRFEATRQSGAEAQTELSIRKTLRELETSAINEFASSLRKELSNLSLTEFSFDTSPSIKALKETVSSEQKEVKDEIDRIGARSENYEELLVRQNTLQGISDLLRESQETGAQISPQ